MLRGPVSIAVAIPLPSRKGVCILLAAATATRRRTTTTSAVALGLRTHAAPLPALRNLQLNLLQVLVVVLRGLRNRLLGLNLLHGVQIGDELAVVRVAE